MLNMVLKLLPHRAQVSDFRAETLPGDTTSAQVYDSAELSSWPYGITYFWLLGQVLCEAQRREHSRAM